MDDSGREWQTQNVLIRKTKGGIMWLVVKAKRQTGRNLLSDSNQAVDEKEDVNEESERDRIVSNDDEPKKNSE